MTLWSIFWRTFAQLATAVFTTAMTYDFVSNRNASGVLLGLGLLGAFVGALVAVLHAFADSPAATAFRKACRSAAQAAAGTLTVLVFASLADLSKDLIIIEGGIAAVVLAFLVTYFSNQGAVA